MDEIERKLKGAKKLKGRDRKKRSVGMRKGRLGEAKIARRRMQGCSTERERQLAVFSRDNASNRLAPLHIHHHSTPHHICDHGWFSSVRFGFPCGGESSRLVSLSLITILCVVVVIDIDEDRRPHRGPICRQQE